MITLAWKNLFYDRIRLAVTLVGIVFALVLILVQFGLFLGFMETSANIVERSGADLWITAPRIPYVNGGSPLSESNRWKVLSVAGVDRVDRYILAWVPWKLPSGAVENVQVVGFNLESRLGGPWSVVAGSVDAQSMLSTPSASVAVATGSAAHTASKSASVAHSASSYKPKT